MGLILKTHLYPLEEGEASTFFSEDLPVILTQQLISPPPSFTGKFLESSAYISDLPLLCRPPHAMLQLGDFLSRGCHGSWFNSRLCPTACDQGLWSVGTSCLVCTSSFSLAHPPGLCAVLPLVIYEQS